MSNVENLRNLAAKCDELAANAPSEVIRDRQRTLAKSYRLMADREEAQDLAFANYVGRSPVELAGVN
jgi:hypothetical protein